MAQNQPNQNQGQGQQSGQQQKTGVGSTREQAAPQKDLNNQNSQINKGGANQPK